MNSDMKNTQIKKGESVKVPQIDCEYLTSGKEYLVKKVFIDNSFLIKSDDGENIFCRVSNCGHLNGMDWILNN